MSAEWGEARRAQHRHFQSGCKGNRNALWERGRVTSRERAVRYHGTMSAEHGCVLKSWGRGQSGIWDDSLVAYVKSHLSCHTWAGFVKVAVLLDGSILCSSAKLVFTRLGIWVSPRLCLPLRYPPVSAWGLPLSPILFATGHLRSLGGSLPPNVPIGRSETPLWGDIMLPQGSSPEGPWTWLPRSQPVPVRRHIPQVWMLPVYIENNRWLWMRY